jgi:MFS family permease
VAQINDPLPNKPAQQPAPVRGEWPRGRFTRGMFSSFAYRNYLLLWTGTVVTQNGQWMQQIALGWLILELTDSPAFLGFVGFARGLPMLFLALPAGVLADRVSRRKIMMWAQGAAAIVALALTLLVFTDLVQAWHVIVISILGGAAMAFVAPTRQALVPSMVPRDHVANAVALNSAGQNSTRIIGPSAAGLLIAWLGTAICFLVQTVGFLLALLMSYRLKLPDVSEVSNQVRAGVATNIADGFRYIRSLPTLSGLMIMAAVPTILAMPYLQMMPVFARDVLEIGSTGLGMLMAASGAGALIGALLFAAYGSRIRQQGRFMVIMASLFGVWLALFAFSPWWQLSLVLVALTSGCSAVYMAQNNTIIQLMVADEYRGRVMSVYLMTFGLMPFGTLPMGALAEAIGAPAAVAIHGGLTTLVVLLVALRLPSLRNLVATEPVRTA